jgi:two-component system LytT family sensor kinase
VLQSAGWSGYFMLRTLGGIANAVPAMFVVHTLLLTATGYSLTLLLASLYRRLITMRAIYTVILSLARWGWRRRLLGDRDLEPCDLCRPGPTRSGCSCWADPAQLRAAGGLVGALLRDQLLPAAGRGDRPAHAAGKPGVERAAGDAALPAEPALPVQHAEFISTLVLLKQTERANAMLARLSSFLRYTLANEPTAQVTLAQEVETLKLYLEIEKMRFEDRLRPHFRIEAQTIGARLPSLLLQPLIENAIKYAVTPSETGADIWLTAIPEGDAVRIEVADNGAGGQDALVATQSTGVGLANTRDRLAQAYGERHRFATRKNEQGGFSVIVEIPLDARPLGG